MDSIWWAVARKHSEATRTHANAHRSRSTGRAVAGHGGGHARPLRASDAAATPGDRRADPRTRPPPPRSRPPESRGPGEELES